MAAVAQVVSELVDRFGRAGIASPIADAELIVGFVTGWTRGEVAAKAFSGAELGDDQLGRIAELASRRETREPLQHITGQAPFRHLVLEVGPGVLVPRPESELVAQLAIDALLQVPHPSPLAVDLGTGSGALALAIATEVPHSRVYAVELASEAHRWAERNIDRLGEGRVSLVQGDAGTSFDELNGTVDVIVANPPYIPDSEKPMDAEVSDFDPASALFGGEDGLRDIRTFLVAAARLLRPGGTVVLEHGDGQGRAVRDIATAAGFRGTTTHTDLLQRERALTAVR